MRSIPRFAACIALAVALLGATASGAQEVPPPSEEVGTAATTTRYFGAEPFQATHAAAAATSRSCSISDDGLTALVLAPVFKESSAATTPSTAPAPMTLSRYDEWSGTYPTSPSNDTNVNANYGLYAFRNPNTAYPRAYWHPGIGIWQYDSAGVGAPFTAVESMHVGVVAADVARVMANRYCNPSSAQAGHPAPFSLQERRYAAWSDWGYPCTLCEGFFQEMNSTTPRFANLELVSGISVLGGTVQHTCVLAGVPGTMPCWYVKPVVGTIQGSTSWATLQPDGGSGPTVAPAPLSHPFYVLDRGTTEERHWLREDTGYSIDISARRTIGKNARPRLNQVGSGLTWASSPGLCDVTTGRGACVPVPPSGVSSASITITGTYRIISLDANGDDQGDVLFYGPGSSSDLLWLGEGAGDFSAAPAITVNMTYDDVLAGDIDGDGDDDLIWYNRSSGSSYLWRSDGDGTFTGAPLAPGVGRRPFLLNLDGDAAEEIFWYAPGSATDKVWNWSGSGFVGSNRTVTGTYTPLVGDFDGNGRDDILWYGPGSTSDGLWLHKVTTGYTIVPLKVGGVYYPIVGNMDGDAADDLLWYAPGGAGDYLWFGAAGGAFANRPVAVNGSYLPVVADLLGTGRDGVLFYAPGTGSDYWWTWSSTRTLTSTPIILPSTQQAVVGPYSAGGADGIFWWAPGAVKDVVWYR